MQSNLDGWLSNLPSPHINKYFSRLCFLLLDLSRLNPCQIRKMIIDALFQLYIFVFFSFNIWKLILSRSIQSRLQIALFTPDFLVHSRCPDSRCTCSLQLSPDKHTQSTLDMRGLPCVLPTHVNIRKALWICEVYPVYYQRT